MANSLTFNNLNQNRKNIKSCDQSFIFSHCKPIPFQTKISEQEADIKPVVPSKIPVGFFRVEEEKRINRALSRDRSGMTKMIRERSMSRIPVFSNRPPYHVIINTVYVYYTLCILYVGIFAAYKYLIELELRGAPRPSS